MIGYIIFGVLCYAVGNIRGHNKAHAEFAIRIRNTEKLIESLRYELSENKAALHALKESDSVKLIAELQQTIHVLEEELELLRSGGEENIIRAQGVRAARQAMRS